MELITLDQTTFQPVNLVENYKSLIWTERYSSAGDFQITSNDVQSLLLALPLESYVSLRESTVPMIVEAHKIEKKPNDAPMLTVTGRSFETVLERRGSVNQLAAGSVRTPWMIWAPKPSDAAVRAIRTVIGGVAQSQAGVVVMNTTTPAVSALDVIPEMYIILPADYQTPAWSSAVAYSPGDFVGVTNTTYVALLANTNQSPPAGAPYWGGMSAGAGPTWPAGYLYEIPPKDLYSTVMDLIQTNHHGLKSVRPVLGGSQIGVEIYNGADQTATIVFDANFDQFDSSTYLLSLAGSTNVGYVYGSNGSQKVLKTAAAEPSGLARRVLVLDNSSDASVNTTDIRTARGLIELYKYNATSLFDGQISDQVAAGFNAATNGYFLGDILTLHGEYARDEQVRVAEFIRTSDATGSKAYPTFEVVTA